MKGPNVNEKQGVIDEKGLFDVAPTLLPHSVANESYAPV